MQIMVRVGAQMVAELGLFLEPRVMQILVRGSRLDEEPIGAIWKPPEMMSKMKPVSGKAKPTIVVAFE